MNKELYETIRDRVAKLSTRNIKIALNQKDNLCDEARAAYQDELSDRARDYSYNN